MMNNKQRILFVIPSYRYGGSITSLRFLLPVLDRSLFDVYIFAITNEGGADIEFSQYAKLIGPVSSRSEQQVGVSQRLISSFSAVIRRVKKSLCKFGIDISSIVFKSVARRLSRYCFDYVVSFQEGPATLLGSSVKARKKITWQHCMMGRFLEATDKSRYQDVLREFDQIVCVSYTEKQEFESLLPSFSDRLVVVYNVVNADYIYKKAQLGGIVFDKSLRNIISVGRIDRVKRFSYIPKIACELKEKGLSFVWRIVGGCADQQEYEELVQNVIELGVSDCVIVCGKEDNPYPFILNSDLLVCLSSSETFNYTIAEAKVLGIPVVSTDFDSVFEFVQDGKNGLISPIQSLGTSIFSILSDEKLYSRISMNCKYDCNQEVVIKRQLQEVFNLE